MWWSDGRGDSAEASDGARPRSINDRLERGLPAEPRLRFPAYDFLKLTGRSTSARGYELFLDALDRLQSTAVKTTITSGHEDIEERRAFSWIDKYRVITRKTETGRRVMVAVELTINEWLWRALVENRRVLTISRNYFALSMGIERRLYELARKHCGRQREWRVGLGRLAEKCGSTRGLKQLRGELAKIARRDSLPDYRLAVEGRIRPIDGIASLIVRFEPRLVANEPDEVPYPLPPADPLIAGRPSARALDRARRAHPGYDIDALLLAWWDWTADRDGTVRNPDQAFLGFCKTYTSHHPLA